MITAVRRSNRKSSVQWIDISNFSPEENETQCGSQVRLPARDWYSGWYTRRARLPLQRGGMKQLLPTIFLAHLQ